MDKRPTMMNTYALHYFGILADLRGLREEHLSSSQTVATALFDEIFPMDGERLRHVVRAVVNDEIVAWDAALKNLDRVAFLPPMSGG